MDVQTILPVKVFITIDTMVIFNGYFDGDGYGDVTCKHSITVIPCLQMYGDNQNYNGQVPPGPPGSDNMNPFMTSPNMPPLLSK